MVDESLDSNTRAPAVVLIDEHSSLGLRPVRLPRPHPGSTASDRVWTSSWRPERPRNRTCCLPSMPHVSVDRISDGAWPSSLRAVALGGSTVPANEGADRPGRRPARAERARGGGDTTRHRRADRRQRASPECARFSRTEAVRCTVDPTRVPASRARVSPRCARCARRNRKPDDVRERTATPAHLPVPPESPASGHRPRPCCDRP